MPYCSVAESWDCRAPANCAEAPARLSTCFACGMHVCDRCSLRRQYYNCGRKRLCFHCLETYEDSDASIQRLLRQRAAKP